MANISAIKLPDGTTYNIKDSSSGYITGMTILSYGSSTWDNFIEAYNANKVVYCRASSNSNPASGSQTRLAFMAYVNNATTPTEVEFQYYRSVSSHTASQQGDQVYVYKLTSNGTWTVTVREASVKVVAGTGLSGSYSNGTMTLTGPTKVSDLTNDSGFITSYTETDPVFTASAAYGITSSDITNWNGKQAALVSGTNIKTVNGNSLLGSGNVTIDGDLNVQSDWNEADSTSDAFIKNKPSIPSATSTTPKMDGTASAGSETTWAKGDHVHPTDTSRAASTHTHTKTDITDFPSLATVATSGSYADLSNKPTIPSVSGITVILRPDQWSEQNMQDVTATGVTANNYVVVSPERLDVDTYVEAGIECRYQNTNLLRFHRKTVVSAEIYVNVLIFN